MKVLYREAFLKDLKKLKGTHHYDKIKELVFQTLPKAGSLSDIIGVKALKNAQNKYRIRIGDYRIGLSVENDAVEIMRVKHRKEFYRYFP